MLYYNFGKSVKIKRTKLNISQYELSKCCGCSRVSIANIEANKHEIKLSLALKISKILELNLDESKEWVTVTQLEKVVR